MKITGKVFALLLVFSVLFSLAGCQSTIQPFPDELLQTAEKIYTDSNPDRAMFTSFDAFCKSYKSADVRAVMVSLTCQESVAYLTVKTVNGQSVLTGKTVKKCVIDSVGESFGGFRVKRVANVDVVQECYFFPKKEEDLQKVLKKLGATSETDAQGNILCKNLKDGDYELSYDPKTEYVLKLSSNELPMEIGRRYTGLLIPGSSTYALQYVMPVTDEERDAQFLRDEETVMLGNGIRQTVLSVN